MTKLINRVNIVLRDVNGAFDKVWTTGLIYRMLNLNLSPNFKKILSNFLQNISAFIEWRGDTSSTFSTFILH